MNDENRLPGLCENRRIRWLVGYPKSGTTWVRMFLNALCSSFPLDINSAYSYAEDDSFTYTHQRMCPVALNKLNPTWLMYYRPAALATVLLESHSRDRVLRTHWARMRQQPSGVCFHPPELSRGAAVIVRDPRDIACSFAPYLNVPLDEVIALMANPNASLNRDDQGMFHFLSSWSNHVRSWTTDNDEISYGVIQYEDLKADPAKWFRHVTDCIGPRGLPEERYDWAIEQTRFAKMQRQEKTGGFEPRRMATSPFFRRGEVGGWRDTLTEEQVRVIEEAHGEVMTELGYELELISC